jgi:2,4-dienoyl-CoA reductase (NADPH2)
MWGPSRVADVVSREPPAELEQDGIDAIVNGFAAAARLARKAGLDGVEVDSGAWSLLRQFQSGLTNQRHDGYGADRLRLTREVLAAVRQAIGDDGILALRLSCDELAPWAGITPEQAGEAVAILAGSLDLLTVVRGGPYSTGAYRPDAHTEPMTNLALGRAMRQAASGQAQVVLQGSVVDPDMAEAALADGTADLVEMTRAQIADARLVSLLRAGQPERIRPCLLCNQTCLVRDNRNPLVTCVGDPRSGHETEDAEVDGDPSVEAASGPPVLIIGGGPAGLECARVLAGAGRRVGVVERRGQLGGALAAAAVGPGRSRLRRIADWLVTECGRLGVEVVLGRHVDAAAVSAARADGWEVVLATGSRPFPNRYPATANPSVIDALTLYRMGLDQLPAGPVVIDDPVGDAVGVAVAEWLAAATDRAVTMVSPDPVAGTLLARSGDLADANVRLQRAGVNRRLRSRLTSVGEGRVEGVDVWTGEEFALPATVLIDCGHRLPDDALYQQLGDSRIRRAGDCVAPRTVHEAILEGRRAALDLLGVRTPVEAGSLA